MAKALDPKVKAERAIARRNERIVALRLKGESLKAIGEKVGLTGPRVYKIVTPLMAKRAFHQGQMA
jgi:hypothetical protein